MMRTLPDSGHFEECMGREPRLALADIIGRISDDVRRAS